MRSVPQKPSRPGAAGESQEAATDAYRRHGAESILKARDISAAGAWAAPRVHRARVPAAIFMAIDKGRL